MNGGRGASKSVYVPLYYIILYYMVVYYIYYTILYYTILYYTIWRREVVREGGKKGWKEGEGEARREGRGGLSNYYDWGFGLVSRPDKTPL